MRGTADQYADTAPERPLAGTTTAAAAAATLLAACGGGDDKAQAQDRAAPAAQPTRIEAHRLLTQASFGPTEAAIDEVAERGIEGWITHQFTQNPPADPATTHLGRWDAWTSLRDTPAGKYSPITSSFYREALLGEDQLRQRVAFALSEIFVVSTVELSGIRARAVASYLDMLRAQAFGNFRTLLEQVSLHPAMGLYLSTLNNKRADGSGRIPDQNYAREVMQLFTIGLVELAVDGNPKAGQPTYQEADVEGLSQVFTGWSWGAEVPAGYSTPMVAREGDHADGAKAFLNDVIAADTAARPSLQAALDRLFNHVNVPYFIGRQLIQRLVTSHPSAGYVQAVAAKFKNDGHGVRGNLQAVLRAILTHDEARRADIAARADYGKLREPVLRLTAYLRAFGARSISGQCRMDDCDDPATMLGQAPMRPPSVFNFFRPGFVPTSGQAGAARMTVPEMQTTTEVSVAGYANFMMDVVKDGLGLIHKDLPDGLPQTRDMQIDQEPLFELAGEPTHLVDTVMQRLLGDDAPLRCSALRDKILPAIEAIKDGDKRRTRFALSMVLVSPEFIVQQ